MPMEFLQVGDSLVVRLAGELDLVAAAQFRVAVEEAIDRRVAANLYVNLEQVTFMDSSFIGALLGRYRYFQEIGGRMGLIRPRGSVRPILELAGIFRVIKEYGSEPEALSVG